MRFGLSEEQQLLRDNLRRYLQDQAPLDRVRKVAEGDAEAGTEILSGLLELGLAGLMVPQAHGGLGLGAFEAAVVAEALGAAVAPVPFVASYAMAPLALARAGSPAQQAAWLPGIAAGEFRLGVGLTEFVGARDGAALRFAQGQLQGTALFVLDGGAVDAWLLADAAGQLYLVPPDQVRQRELVSIDRTRCLVELTLDGAEAEPLPGGRADTEAVLDLGRVLLAADSIGAGQAMLDKAVAYAGERQQFGRVIGSFQAVEHMCAEMAAELEPARALVWYAAYVQDAQPHEARLLACHAKAHTSEIGRFVAKTATEVHGGMGFTDMLGLHYWFKRLGVNRQLLGSPELVRYQAAEIQGWLR
jgi:alkylation response protein AidB-like acyl-CoA dehydrogenase